MSKINKSTTQNQSKEQKLKIGKIFQFKITLIGSEPRIWRRILAPADYTFFDLHCAIQDAMGWTDSHLHAFYLQPPKQPSNQMITIQFPDPQSKDLFYPQDSCDERKERIADYFDKIVKQCSYCYDFGDSWEHKVLLEGELEPDSKADYPECLAGKNACPPDDCGGIGGYYRLQEILKDPDHREYKDMVEWLGLDDPSEFDPSEFNPKDVYFKDPKKRLKEWNEGFGV